MKYSLDQLKQLCLKGLQKREIARIIGMTTQSVTKAIKKNNLEYIKPIRYKDLTGKKYFKLEVIKFDGLDRHGKSKWLCLCECGNTKSISIGSLNRKLTRSCGCISKNIKRIKSYKDIPHQWFRRLFNQATTRDYEFKITIKDIWDQYEKQDKKCYYTRTNVNFHSDMSNKPHLCTASIDRIDSNRGYTKDNIVICHKMVNLSKSFLSKEEFIKMCNLIAHNHKEKYEDCINYKFRELLCKI